MEKIQEELFKYQKEKNKSLEKKIINVLIENQTKDKTKLFGRSEYMTSVITNGSINDVGKILPVKINKSNRSTLFGEIIKTSNKRVA